MKTVSQLPLPPGIDLANAMVSSYQASPLNLQSVAFDWIKQHDLKSVGSDPVKIFLLIIDDQYDFSFPEGSLYVGGRSGTAAMDDHKRLVAFIYKYLHIISQVIPSADTHLPFQVFHPCAHLNRDGRHPDIFTIVPAETYHKEYHSNPAMAAQLGVSPVWLDKQFNYYVDQLEIPDQSGNPRYQLQIWPYHCLLGSPGHRLAGVVEEARLFHCFARGAANVPEIKGGSPLTEHYSILKPEVMTTWEGKPIPYVQRNRNLYETLTRADIVIGAGQAGSHCFAWSIDDFLNEIKVQDPSLAKKFYLLKDCCSPVVIPGVIDFTPQQEEAFDRFAADGMNVVKSTDPIETWPGIDSILGL